MPRKKLTTKDLSQDHIYRLLEESGLDIDIGWRRVDFVFESNLETEHGEKLWGLVDFDKGLLHLNLEECDEELGFLNLLHELTHICLGNCGLPSDIEREGFLPNMSNEHLTELSSTGWLTLLKANKELFELIIKAL